MSEREREKEKGGILYSSVSWSQLSVSHNRPYRTVSSMPLPIFCTHLVIW